MARDRQAARHPQQADGFYAIGLGVEAVNPLELARAYATFANGGRRIDGAMVGNKPRVFEKVNENGRRTLFNAPVPRKRVMSPTQAAILNSILQKVVRQGTGTRAALPDRPVAGKTGTTENYGDAWFVGYTPQLVVAIWVGYPESSKPMLTEFHGDAGHRRQLPGADLEELRGEGPAHLGPAAVFPDAAHALRVAEDLVRRGDRVLLDNGLCRSTREVAYFTAPARREARLPRERGASCRTSAG